MTTLYSVTTTLRPFSVTKSSILNAKTLYSRCSGAGQKSIATFVQDNIDIMIANRSLTNSLRTQGGSDRGRNRAICIDATGQNNEARSVLITPPPTPPLLLEGDEMFISRAGKSHTVYHLERTSNNSYSSREIFLEEKYDIEGAWKRMSLVGPATLLSDDCNAFAYSNKKGQKQQLQLDEIFSFDLQEINHGVQNGSGTGSMSWDSSVVMGLYFAANPDELRGNILELGSGVGLGGILSNAVTKNSTHTSARVQNSVTLTDVNDDVLDMLRKNTHAAAFNDDMVFIKKLDWFDFLGDSKETKPNSQLKEYERYDTIIASDCAYLHSQIDPLSETMLKLLDRDDGGSKLHMFAPYNRGVVHDLVEQLHGKNMHVQLEELEMSKYRIKREVQFEKLHWNADMAVSNDDDMTCSISKFLHITAWHKTMVEIADDVHIVIHDAMTDID